MKKEEIQIYELDKKAAIETTVYDIAVMLKEIAIHLAELAERGIDVYGDFT